MKKNFVIFTAIIVILLSSCTDKAPESSPADFNIEQLAGAPKPPEQWGTQVSNFPNNVANTITGDPLTTRTITWQSTLQRGEVITCNTRYPSTAVLISRRYHHRVDLSGLTADTEYSFIAGYTGAYSQVYSFTTGKTVDHDGFSVLHVTDPQIGSTIGEYEVDAAVWKRVIESAVEKCPDAAFIVNTGDITENADKDIISFYFDYAQEIIANYAFVYSMGNNDKVSWYNTYFYTPDTDNDGLLYSFDYGNVHFINIDSNVTLTDEQMEWLENDLKGTSAQWKTAITHDADYSRSSRNTAITKLFDQYNVDLVMAGHNHFYARSKPIDTEGNEKANGTVWSIPNTAGTKFNSTAGRPFLAVDEQPELPMFSEYTFTETNIYLKAYTVDEEGNAELFDSYTFR